MRRLAYLLLQSALAVSFAAYAPPASAAVFRAATVERAARTSDVVVRGTVERMTSRYSDDGTAIVTDVTIAVASAWKGAAGDRLVVTIPGGEVGGVGEVNDAAPKFTEGEEVVVFATKRGKRWRVNGLAQGKFHVEGGVASPGFAADEVTRSGARKADAEAWIGEMAIGELENRVRAAK